MPEKAYDPHYYHHSYGHHHVSSSNLRSYPQASNFRNVQRAAGNEFARHDMGFGGSANGPNSSYSNGAHDTSIYAQQHSYSPYDPYKMGHNMSANNYYSTYSYNNFESSSSPMYRSRANGYAMRDAQQFYNQYGGNHHRNDYPANGMMSSRSSADYYSNGQSNNNGQIIDANHHYHSYSMNGAYNDYSQNLSAGNQYAAASGFGMGSVIGNYYLNRNIEPFTFFLFQGEISSTFPSNFRCFLLYLLSIRKLLFLIEKKQWAEAQKNTTLIINVSEKAFYISIYF